MKFIDVPLFLLASVAYAFNVRQNVLILKRLKAKPLGYQTVYDIAVNQCFNVQTIAATFIWILYLGTVECLACFFLF